MNTQTTLPVTPRNVPSHAPRRAAFSLTELLVVLAVIGLLSVTVLPALARTRPNGQAARCMNNLRQMMAGMLVYAGDNSDLLPPNPDDANTFFGHNWVPGNAGGAGPGVLWRPEDLADPRRCAILSYIGTNTSLFKCPADERWGIAAPSSIYAGQKVPAPRTISMNGAVGTACQSWLSGGGHGGIPNQPTQAPWLGGDKYAKFSKSSTIAALQPSSLWVLVDESAIGLNDGAFGVTMVSSAWVDAPGAYHDGAGSFAFADGHCELRKWQSELTGQRPGAITPGTPEEADYLWLRDRTSAAR